MGEVGAWLMERFSAFDFNTARFKEPTRTFSGELNLKICNKRVNLIEVGPAHTQGDILVHVPEDRVVFTGDILFIGGTPIMWVGPVDNWIRACQRIMAMDVDTIVPGHGPITDKAGVARVRDYLVHVDKQARLRFDAGMGVAEASRDITVDDFSEWGEQERIAVNIHSLYREYRKERQIPAIGEMLALMAKWPKRGANSRNRLQARSSEEK